MLLSLHSIYIMSVFDDYYKGLQRGQIKRGEPASLQGMFKNFGAEMDSFFSGPSAQAKSRRKQQNIRDEQLKKFDSMTSTGSSMSNVFSDITRPPKIDETNPALPVQGPQEQPRQVTAEGSLKADQLMAMASDPVALGGVVDDVVNAGKFQASPQATPKADAYMAKREAPKFDASKVMTKDAQGNYVPEEDPSKLRAAEMGFNRNALAMEREDRTSRRKDFASQLNAANYNPATASSEDKAKFYARGKDMGLSSDQIDSYANKQLDKQAERDYKRANMGKFLETADSRRGRSSGVQGSRGLRRQSNSNIRTSQADLDKQDRRNQYFG